LISITFSFLLNTD